MGRGLSRGGLFPHIAVTVTGVTMAVVNMAVVTMAVVTMAVGRGRAGDPLIPGTSAILGEPSTRTSTAAAPVPPPKRTRLVQQTRFVH
ncbi:MAG TPA: hypothetical protein VEJ87_13665 [Acidimicrobiales bacterium]|nr:hypothetical protein [Acidimicrobiales bacterium]